MRAGILGLRKAEGKSKSTGQPYSGWFLYYGSTDEGTVGMKTSDTFVNSETMQSVLDKVGNDPKKLVTIIMGR